MSNGTKGNWGNNLTTIIVALLGTISAIGGAYITTYGVNSADRTEAAAATTVSVSNGAAQVLPGQPTSVAEASPAPQATIPIVVAPAESAAEAFLPNSKQISYNRAWPNDNRANQLVLETVEVADNVVRAHVRFDNATGGTVSSIHRLAVRASAATSPIKKIRSILLPAQAVTCLPILASWRLRREPASGAGSSTPLVARSSTRSICISKAIPRAILPASRGRSATIQSS